MSGNMRPVTDLLRNMWCCLSCSHKFAFGKAIAADVMRCPKCRSPDIHPIEQKVVELSEYHGIKETEQ